MSGFRKILDLFRSKKSSPPRFGVVLGGGGARGLAHVGVLKVLDDAGIKPDIIVGTSMGGLVGGAYARGMRVQEMEEEALKLAETNRLIQLADRIPTLKALFSGKRIEQYLADLVGEDMTFAELPIPFAVIAINLNTGRELTLNEGLVAPALRATMSLPGVFVPVEINGQRLVDGGFLNNVPVNAARNLGADIVLAVDVLPGPTDPPLEMNVALPGIRDLLEASLLTAAVMTQQNLKNFPPDILIRPEISREVGILTGFSYAEDSIKAGAAAMQAALPELKTRLRATS